MIPITVWKYHKGWFQNSSHAWSRQQNASLAEREIKNQPLWEVLRSEVGISQTVTSCFVLFLLDTVDNAGLFWIWIMWSNTFSLNRTFWRTKIWVFMTRYYLNLKREIKEKVLISEISKTLKIKRNYWFLLHAYFIKMICMILL